MVMLVGLRYLAPSAGAVRLTLGAVLVAATVMVRDDEVA